MVSSGVRATGCVAVPTEGASTSHTPQQRHWQMEGGTPQLPAPPDFSQAQMYLPRVHWSSQEDVAQGSNPGGQGDRH